MHWDATFQSTRPRGARLEQDLIQDLKQELTKAGVRVTSFGPGAQLGRAVSGGKALIVITGHSSAELAGFVRALGEQGAFKNN